MTDEREERITAQERADWGNEFLCAERRIAALEKQRDELKAKLDSRDRRIKELCLWGQQGEKERIELRAEVERLKKHKED